MVPILRIIAGQYGSRLIQAPSGSKTRPTSEMARESLFNIIREEVADSRFLDLFAGSGAVGIEALSRGAKEATFVDFDRDCCELIKKNLTTLDAPRRSWHVVNADIERQFARKLYKDADLRFVPAGKTFDIIFADPPYNLVFMEELPNMIAENELLSEEGLFILEHRHDTKFEEMRGDLVITRVKAYGDTRMTYYRRQK